MLPWLTTLPAVLPAVKSRLPLMKSLLPMSSDDANMPPTFTREFAPKMMPLGLIRNTWPFDCSAPKICEGLWPTMRFNTADDELCCRNCVNSPGLIEKLAQLMMEPGELVIVSTLPLLLIDTCPLTTCAPVGLAYTGPAAKQLATRTDSSLRLSLFPP